MTETDESGLLHGTVETDYAIKKKGYAPRLGQRFQKEIKMV